LNLLGFETFGRVCLFVLSAIAVSACSAGSLTGGSVSASAVTKPEVRSSGEAIAKRKLQAALENTVSGKAVRWQDPDSGASGSITPLKTWKTAEGVYCRSYSEMISLASGRSLNRRGVACRSENAVWEAA